MKHITDNKMLSLIAKSISGTEWEGKVYVVGGLVRDFLMGKESNDIDLLIDGDINAGIDFSLWFTKNAKIYKKDSNPLIYGTYGTSMFHFMGEKIECVAPRSEKYKDDSRNPIVESCTLEEECLRRDLTINSLFINLSNHTLYDFSGKGVNDIHDHIIRSTSEPDIIFSQDPLRMLRCIRFASRYGWNIDSDTLYGIKNNVERINIISQERITEEINKILISPNPAMGLSLLVDTGLIKNVLPEFVDTINMGQNKYHFGTVWEHTLAVVEKTQPILENRIAALFHDIGKIKTRKVDENGIVHFINHEIESGYLADIILKRMKYPNDFIKCVKKAIINHMRTKSYGDDCSHVKPKSLRKLQYVIGEDFNLLMDLIDADNKAHAKEYCMPNQVAILKKLSDKLVAEGMDCFNMCLPINGDDIMEYKNIPQGVEVKAYLDHIKKCYINNPKITKEQCFKQIKNLMI